VIRFKKLDLVQGFSLLCLKLNFVPVRLLCLVNVGHSGFVGMEELRRGAPLVKHIQVFPPLVVTSMYPRLSV